jgi:hypothetical protein
MGSYSTTHPTQAFLGRNAMWPPQPLRASPLGVCVAQASTKPDLFSCCCCQFLAFHVPPTSCPFLNHQDRVLPAQKAFVLLFAAQTSALCWSQCGSSTCTIQLDSLMQTTLLVCEFSDLEMTPKKSPKVSNQAFPPSPRGQEK